MAGVIHKYQMKLITKKRVVIFLSALIIPTGYLFARYVFDWCGIPWKTKYNLPGFLILQASVPWSLPILNYHIQLVSLLGSTACNFLFVISMCVGFAVNTTIVITLIGKLIRITSGSGRA
jgi:hypothetical protein